MIDKDFQSYIDREMRRLGKREGLALAGFYQFTLEDVITGEKIVKRYKNLVPTTGLTLIANNLTDATPTNTMLITHAALGTGTNAPAAGNTQLQTETYRNAIASLTNSSGVAYATAFFNQTEVTGTFKEAGLFTNATGAANSGVLLSRVAIDVTKTNTQKLTIDWTLTLTAA